MNGTGRQERCDLLIHNALVAGDYGLRRGWIAVNGGLIADMGDGDKPANLIAYETVDARGALLLPGVIDEHVHFREPGMTHKADMASESAAAAAGGVTSIIDMPNTRPATVTLDDILAKEQRAAECATANYAFYIGATNDNFDQLARADYSRVAGIKLFLGSSTGNMLVDNPAAIERILNLGALVAVHAESESVIAENRRRLCPDGAPEPEVAVHSLIRDRRACFEASKLIVDMARRCKCRLHLLHVSTADELSLLRPDDTLVTAETCPQYLLFTTDDYSRLGARIKCNPAVKDDADRLALRKAVASRQIATIATDHAPHLLAEKQGGALTAVSGMPMIQFSLPAMLSLADQGVFDVETVVDAMAHAPARIFRIDRRGFIRPGFYADLTLVEKHDWTVSDNDVISRCAWTPLNGLRLSHRVAATWLNGLKVFDGNSVDTSITGMHLNFR